MQEPSPELRREQRWRGIVAALLVALLVPILPPLRVFFPVEQILLLLLPAIAVCALAGWWSGGRGVIAILWIVAAAWMLSIPDHSVAPHFDRLQRGWCILLAATFGVVSIAAPARDFFTRALLSVLAALVAGTVVLLLAGAEPLQVGGVVTQEFMARIEEFARVYDAQLAQAGYLREMAEENPMLRDFPAQLQSLALRTAGVFPALLALESLAALALAWSLFHRLSRTRIGPPLPLVRNFRFHDELVWGLLAGVSLLLLPALPGTREGGWMLVVFFSGLYIVRGLGVASWLLRTRGIMMKVLAVFFLLVLPPYALAALLGLGVGDTWVDWRHRSPPAK
jgi:hypothetical protein